MAFSPPLFWKEQAGGLRPLWAHTPWGARQAVQSPSASPDAQGGEPWLGLAGPPSPTLCPVTPSSLLSIQRLRSGF